ncbi:IS91 family transposase [Leisingera aquimarina]|uniref:IS91 family transposase n=1 Tax=Leisingera aquimarina TaxID=476529 RepID=UPI001FDED204|nr:transposase [Leisingera aquimarina]
MRSSADTVIRIAAGPKHLGARAGLTSVLHTSCRKRVFDTTGSAMTHHPHVHMIVPPPLGRLLPQSPARQWDGGLSADGTGWIACRGNFFLSVRVLSRLYRRFILGGLADRAAFDAFLQPLRRIDWVVYAKEPFAGPGPCWHTCRATPTVPRSPTAGLIRMDGRGLTFRVKDYRVHGPGRQTSMTLKAGEFIRRFLIHVLPKGRHRIRHYGFFGNGNRAANTARIRERLGAGQSDPGLARDGTAGEAEAPARVLALPCPCCGGRLIIAETMAPERRPRAPPGTARAAA